MDLKLIIKNNFIYSIILFLSIFSGYLLFKENNKEIYIFEENKKKDTTLDFIKIDKENKLFLENCNDKFKNINNKYYYTKEMKNCLKSFYKDLTIKEGPDISLNYIYNILDNKFYQENVKSCHTFTHGVGEGAYLYFDMDFTKVLEIFKENNFVFKKIIENCGNAYLHGIIIEFTKQKNSISEDFLKDLCYKEGIEVYSCMHGIGHAILIDFDYDLSKSLDLCKKISKEKDLGFHCYTGVFMEYINTVTTEKDFLVDDYFAICKQDLFDDIQESACYHELSFKKIPDNYIKSCNNIESGLNRNMCIKNNVTYMIFNYPYINFIENNFCSQYKNINENIFCYLVIGSLYKEKVKSDSYLKVFEKSEIQNIKIICDTLPNYKKFYCKNFEYIYKDNVYLLNTVYMFKK